MGKHRKPVLIETTELCKHGCGNIAKYKTPSGHLICESAVAKCLTVRAKNSNGLKKAHEQHPGGFYDYNSLSKETKDKMAHSKGKTHLDYEPLKRQKENRHKNFIDGVWKSKQTGFALDPNLRWKRNKFYYFDSDGNSCLLESWNELKLANELDKNNVKWIRPKAFKLSDGKNYEPDFYLPEYNVYLDPKCKFFGKSKYLGYKPNESQVEKIKRFEQEYNVKVLILWDHEKDALKWQHIKGRVAE